MFVIIFGDISYAYSLLR